MIEMGGFTTERQKYILAESVSFHRAQFDPHGIFMSVPPRYKDGEIAIAANVILADIRLRHQSDDVDAGLALAWLRPLIKKYGQAIPLDVALRCTRPTNTNVDRDKRQSLS